MGMTRGRTGKGIALSLVFALVTLYVAPIGEALAASRSSKSALSAIAAPHFTFPKFSAHAPRKAARHRSRTPLSGRANPVATRGTAVSRRLVVLRRAASARPVVGQAPAPVVKYSYTTVSASPAPSRSAPGTNPNVPVTQNVIGSAPPTVSGATGTSSGATGSTSAAPSDGLPPTISQTTSGASSVVSGATSTPGPAAPAAQAPAAPG
ncbi:MAG: hypothetical protein JWN32_1806, partial [Solirubrobacterales bacterium]|nr:hypothetical protein [Solirubrobacterales bacterium]